MPVVRAACASKLMTTAAFDAFCAALEDPDDVRLKRATAFWDRLGEPEAAELGIDSLAYSQSTGKHSAADLLTHAHELGYSDEEILVAALAVGSGSSLP